MNGPDLARLGRAVMPLAKEVFEAAAVEAGVCIRPVSMSVADTTTGEVSIIDVPIAGGC